MDEHSKTYHVSMDEETQRQNTELLGEIEQLYMAVASRLNMRLSQLNAEVQRSSRDDQPSTSDRHNELRLERVRIEKFGKDTSKWPNFKDQFENYIHNSAHYSDMTKFLHLDAHITPDSEPYDTIRGIERRAENYQTA